MHRKTLVLVTLFMAVCLVAGATDGKWLNVHVTENESNTNVKVHLPLNLVLSVIGAVNVEGFEGGKVHLHTEDIDIEWMEIFSSIRDAVDGEYIVVESDEADVNVSKKADTILVTVNQKTDEQAQVEIVLPAQIINAIQIDEEDRIDIAALLKAFDDLPVGDLVRVTSADANVRVWVE
ncbi:MAG: hypothetical protein KAJ78_04075 [Acidobacteria bacterium]|nr:hypothetical protein [Acidobacteriota bacterium]